jgi:hypothetical protein
VYELKPASDGGREEWAHPRAPLLSLCKRLGLETRMLPDITRHCDVLNFPTLGCGVGKRLNETVLLLVLLAPFTALLASPISPKQVPQCCRATGKHGCAMRDSSTPVRSRLSISASVQCEHRQAIASSHREYGDDAFAPARLSVWLLSQRIRAPQSVASPRRGECKTHRQRGPPEIS